MKIKPNKGIWNRVNQVVLDENSAEVVVTFISGICSILIDAGIVENEKQARVHVAAMILSPDDAPVGSLVPMLEDELTKLKGN